MNVYYVTNKQPISHNGSGSSSRRKQEFKDDFNATYGHLYVGLPIKNKTLQSNIVYIHQQRPGNIPDVDNLSKPMVDAFSGVIYEDDRQIIRRSASIIELKDFDIVSVDATNMPVEIFEAFEDYYERKETNIVFFEVGEFDVSQIKVGELWYEIRN